MNLLHMKYAVVVAETNSINKAADILYVGQPTLSRAIKELESNLGVALFERSAKGMTLTPDGETFVRYAKTVLEQVDALEDMFQKTKTGKLRFSLSVPRASYITEAFAAFSKLIDKNTPAELFYKETNSMRTIRNVLQENYKLGIVRYAENYDKYYKDMMQEKGLEHELVTKFRYVLLMSEESELAKKDVVTYADLKDKIEIAHADPYVPSLPFAQIKKEELPDNSDRRIFIFERASQFELLSQNPETFMWVSSIPKSLLARYGLTQRVCEENRRIYKDVLVYRKDYTLSKLDNLFIEQLVKTKREVMK